MTPSAGTGASLRPPSYAEIGSVLRLLDGELIQRVRNLMNSIFDQAGCASVDWSEPDRWIDACLGGDLGALARKVWEGSGKAINPRYLYDPFMRAWTAISFRRRNHSARAGRLTLVQAALPAPPGGADCG